MSTTEQPAPRPIIPARLAELLQRAISWRFGAPSVAVKEITVQRHTENTDERQRGELPWWVAHHPAVSFRGSRTDENRG